MTTELHSSDEIWNRGVLEDAVNAHFAFATARPWMPKPNPVAVDVRDIRSMIDLIDSQRVLLTKARNVLSHPSAWATENAQARFRLSEEIAEAIR